ncbi:MAG: RsmE family RNA methyltransferase [Planctomycetaceae bacterium]
MADRFFCPDLSTGSVTLEDAEAHHVIHVLRMSIGQTLELFDGCGTSATAVIANVGRRTVTVDVTERNACSRSERQTLTIAAAVPKGDRLKWMVEKLTELGVDRYVPLMTTRSVVDPKQAKLDRVQATVISACKQCRRNWLMEITEPMRVGDILQNTVENTTVFIAHPTHDPADGSDLPGLSAMGPRLSLIGPEGGFTGDEVELAVAAGARRLAWPGHILRIETAAIMAAVTLGGCRL